MRKPRDNQAFLLMRKGIFEHVRKGWMDEQMFLAYSILLETCDWATGVWHGSGARLRNDVGAQWSERNAQRVLERLEAGRYIHSTHQRGKRGNYNIYINNYIPTSGPNKGKKLRQVSAGYPLTDVKTDDMDVATLEQSDDKSAAMAVGAFGKVTTELTTEVTTKVTTQVAGIQEVLQETLPSVAQEVLPRKSLFQSISAVPKKGVFEEEPPE